MRTTIGVGLVALGWLGWGAPAQGAPAEVPPDLQRKSARRAPPRTPPRARPQPTTQRRPPAPPPARMVLRGAKVPATTGEYSGVTPGLPRLPRIWLPRSARKRCYLTWTGFQIVPQGSRLFLQFNKRPSYKLVRKTGRLLLEIPACRVAHWNNRRPLDMRWFDTPVQQARVWRSRRKAVLSIQLKKPATPTIRRTTLQGWHYLFITFTHTRGVAPVPRRAAPRPPARRRGRGPTP